jgi:hypothetical protein
MTAKANESAPTLIELMERSILGEVVLTVEEAQPWALMKVSRSAWYRSAKAGEFDAFLRRIGRSYRILLRPYLSWLSADTHEGESG